ncbi:RING zinc finger-containing protein [Tieghemostelium lacteum]|uniref:RING zinc finger-containing protein n=1 Tax=Tieghemostelium lacteum TaxID=361077 RepID=A0A152AA69_TIELA|nr:RING zinc finger-containing protein [Tieghemostelium lacteum]|eukprot:KYR02967.1 RING zinc finger-containing protein [Tieghemostelium lacteum]
MISNSGNSITIISNTSNSNNTNSNGGELNILYRYNKDKGVERINLKTGEHQFLLDKNKSGIKNHVSSFFYQNNTVNNSIYLFQEEKYYTLNLKQSELEWKTERFKDNEELYSQSSIYDGRSFIYIFGGESDNTPSGRNTKIYKFDVHKHQFIVVNTELLVSSRYHSLCRDGNDIYLIGGEDDYSNYINRIDRFNVVTERLESIARIPISSYIINSGCWCPKYQCFFLLSSSDKSHFYKYDPSTGKSTKLQACYGGEVFFSKLYYDGNDLIYLISQGCDSIICFDIKENTCTDILEDIFINNPISHYDYITITNQ